MSVRQKVKMMNDVIWKGEYTMEDFVVEFTKRIPILIRTLTGSLGIDEIHVISGDEIYWVTGLKKQKRIVAVMKDRQRYLSIPINYHLPFELYVDAYTPKKTPQGKTMDEIWKTVDFQSGKKYFIRAVKNEKLFFQIGSQDWNTARFGVLEIVDSYDEKYLLGHSICGNQIHSNTFAIPVYLNIELTVATSFVNHQQECFDNWLKLMHGIASTFSIDEVKICEEIILFDKCPQNGAYEYIDPRTFAKNIKSIESLDSYTKETNPYVIDKAPSIPDKSISMRRPGIRSVDLPPIPRRTPTPPISDPNKATDIVAQKFEIYENQSGDKIRNKPPPPKPHFHNPAHKVRNEPKGLYERPRPPKPDDARYESVKRVHNVDEENTFNLLLNKSENPDPSLKPDSGYVTKKPTSTGNCFTSGDLLSIYEVAPTADLAQFSIRDVQRSLKLLNLEKHCKLFEDLQIDGELLLSMDQEVLISECQFTKIEALKLSKFKSGWRPNP